jgi:hypothetical protein
MHNKIVFFKVPSMGPFLLGTPRKDSAGKIPLLLHNMAILC